MFNPHTIFELSTITCNEDMKVNTKCKNSRFEPSFEGVIYGSMESALSVPSSNKTFSVAFTANWLRFLQTGHIRYDKCV